MANVHCNIEIINRFKRLEGQIRGIMEMLENGSECEDILIQISAVSSALNNTAKIILNEHIMHCVVEGIKNEDKTTIEKLKSSLEQFLKLK